MRAHGETWANVLQSLARQSAVADSPQVQNIAKYAEATARLGRIVRVLHNADMGDPGKSIASTFFVAIRSALIRLQFIRLTALRMF